MNSRPGALLPILLLSILLAGCGSKSSIARLPIHGTVSLASGEKLHGSISFRPAAGRPGPAANTAVIDGNYQFTANNGPTAGPHQVIVQRVASTEDKLKAISAAVPTAKKPSRQRPEPSPTGAKESASEWTRSIDVPTGGNYQCDFQLDGN